jgi:hypothetical protein
MTKRNRVFAAVLLAYAIGVGWLMWRQLAEIDPRYRESAEESLVEVAHLMAAQIERRWDERAVSPAEPVIDLGSLAPLFRDLYARELDADIFGFRKTRIELRMTAGCCSIRSAAAKAPIIRSGATSSARSRAATGRAPRPTWSTTPPPR